MIAAIHREAAIVPPVGGNAISLEWQTRDVVRTRNAWHAMLLGISGHFHISNYELLHTCHGTGPSMGGHGSLSCTHPRRG
jgi:hypothetical protein